MYAMNCHVDTDVTIPRRMITLAAGMYVDDVFPIMVGSASFHEVSVLPVELTVTVARAIAWSAPNAWA